MRFTQTPEGKNVFLSVDSRVTRKNPFYKAWKAKSFTDGDITLHFAIFDVLYDPETKMTLTELIEEIDQRLSSRMAFDESTLRKKLKEYAEEGIIRMEKPDGRFSTAELRIRTSLPCVMWSTSSARWLHAALSAHSCRTGSRSTLSCFPLSITT